MSAIRLRFIPTACFLLGALALVFAGCQDRAPGLPPMDTLTWKTFSNPVSGYRMEIPTVFSPQSGHGDRDTLFRYEGFPLLAVNFTDEAEARQRGLWATSDPVGTAEIAGRKAELYRYRHYDGPSFMTTVSYVVEYRGRYLAFEFRTEDPVLGAIQQRIIDSIRLEDEQD